MVRAGDIGKVVDMSMTVVDDSVDLFQLVKTVVESAALEQKSLDVESCLDHWGCLYTLHASRGNWSHAAEAMDQCGKNTVSNALSKSEIESRTASKKIMELAHAANTYFDHKQPWKDAKDEGMRPRMEATIYSCLDCIKGLAVAIAPIIPETASKIWQMLGYVEPLEQKQWQEIVATKIPEGQTLGVPEILFQKIEDDQIEQEIERLHHMKQSQGVSA